MTDLLVAANAFTTVSVVYLTESLGMSATQIIIFFLITLLGTIPGTKLAALVTKYTNPLLSWQLSMVTLFMAALIGALALDGVRNNNYAYGWGVVIGICLGWFYPTENLFFSMCLPKGQEAELAGFFVYCTQILGWLPPLLFTILVEQSVHQKYGVIVTASFLLVAAALLRCAAPWDEIVAESQKEHHKEEEAHVLEEGEAAMRTTNDQKEDVQHALEESEA
jgi:MFS-type transporter involved in bile tolerance (Atg22 family)